MGSEERKSLIEWVVAEFALPGQGESGDLVVVQTLPSGVLVGVADGLGHGHHAAAAAKLAQEVLTTQPDESLMTLVQRCHERLRDTRGVALSLAYFHSKERTMTWTGVGNVDGVLVRADPSLNPSRERIVLRPGVVGYQLPHLYTAVVPVSRGDILVFATDGIRTDFAEGILLHEPLQRIADSLCTQYRKGTDDALVFVARYGGNSE